MWQERFLFHELLKKFKAIIVKGTNLTVDVANKVKLMESIKTAPEAVKASFVSGIL